MNPRLCAGHVCAQSLDISFLPASTEKTTGANDLSLLQPPLEPAFGPLHGQNLGLQVLQAQLKTLQLSGPSLSGRPERGDGRQRDGRTPVRAESCNSLQALAAIRPSHPSAAV